MRWILFWFALLLSAAFLLIAYKPFRYQRSDPHYRWIMQRVDESRASLDRGDTSNLLIDWRQFPGPAWSHICVVGGYENVSDVADRHNIVMSKLDRTRYSILVSEWEAAVLIAYPDTTHRVFLLPYGYPQVRQDEAYCLDRGNV